MAISFWHALRNQFNGQHRLAALTVNLFWTFVAIVVTVIIGRIVKNLLRRSLVRAHVPLNVIALSGNGISILLVIFCAAVVLSIFGVPPTAVVTAFSLATAGIVLAFQDVLKNFIAGVYLLVEHPFTIGDHIKVRDTEGTVEAVNIRTTALKTEEGVVVLVPNNVVFTEIVQNRSVSGIAHIALTLTNVQGSADDVSARARAVLSRLDGIAVQPEPQTQILAIKDGAAEMQLDFWYHSAYAKPTPQAISLLRDEFPDASITSVASTGK